MSKILTDQKNNRVILQNLLDIEQNKNFTTYLKSTDSKYLNNNQKQLWSENNKVEVLKST